MNLQRRCFCVLLVLVRWSFTVYMACRSDKTLLRNLQAISMAGTSEIPG